MKEKNNNNNKLPYLHDIPILQFVYKIWNYFTNLIGNN